MSATASPAVGVPGARRDRFVAFAPLGIALVVAFLLWRGHAWPAALILAVALGVVQARRLSPRFALRFDRRLASVARAVAHGAGTAMTWLLLGPLYVVVFVPVAAYHRLRGGSAAAHLGRWAGRGEGPARGRSRPSRSFGVEPPMRSDRGSPLLVRVAAVVALVVAVDLVAGALLTGLGLLGPGDREDIRDEITGAQLAVMTHPNVVDEPWARDFGESMAAFELTEPRFLPFMIRGHHPYTSPHLNVDDEERRSYLPPSGTAEPLRVAFFGGSVMFGVGQRDEHTIPSAVARLAEEDGIALEVHNHGFPGWVSWQEFQYLERLLARGREYDLVVFLDGYNEFEVQRQSHSADPTHNGANALQGLVEEFHEQRHTEQGFFGTLGELVDSYRRASALSNAWDRLSGRDFPVPGVSAGQPAPIEDQTDAALDVYERSTAMIDALADRHDLPVALFWQPRRPGWPDEVRARLAPHVVDLTDAFGERADAVYIDDVHTNEEGARLLAEAIWAEIGPMLAAAGGAPAG